jgi:carbon-monoxide dehydrogenase medium subunit
MKAAEFEYAAPTTVDDAVSLLGVHADDAAVLAGGQSLVPLLAPRLATPRMVIDINRVAGMDEVRRENGHVRVGALVRHSVLTKSGSPADVVPLLGLAAPLIGHFQIRNRGTVCGSMTHADAAAEWPLIAATLDAEIELRSSHGVRTVRAREFFEGPFMTSRNPDELAVAVRFPVWHPGAGFAVEEFARRSGDFAIAGSACGIEITDGRVSRCAIGLLGLAGVPLRADAAEVAVTGAAVDDLDPDDVARMAIADVEPPSDIHASSRYRRRVGAAMVAKAFANALREARND